MEFMDEIYMKHSKMIYYFLLSKTNNPEIAEELTQETFYQAIKNIHKFEGKSSVSTWICGIANNVWLTYIRKNKENSSLDEVSEEQVESSTENNLRINWDSKEILKLLHHLKEPMKEVMYLRLVGNLSFRDIGEIMEKTENWARVTFYRGKEKIIEGVKNNE